MPLDPYISPNQAVVKGGDVGADGENTTDAPSGKTVKGQLVPGGVETKKAPAKKEPEPEPAKAEAPKAEAAPKPDSK